MSINEFTSSHIRIKVICELNPSLLYLKEIFFLFDIIQLLKKKRKEKDLCCG